MSPKYEKSFPVFMYFCICRDYSQKQIISQIEKKNENKNSVELPFSSIKQQCFSIKENRSTRCREL